ncbi:hypothetical protein ACTXT7_017503, partial [Hymenolepis weldensis]
MRNQNDVDWQNSASIHHSCGKSMTSTLSLSSLAEPKHIKWVAVELSFGSGNTYGGGTSRNSQASSSATHHSTSSFRGGFRGFGRQGSNNGPMPTRKQGSYPSGGFRRPRQTNVGSANNPVEKATAPIATTTSSNQGNGPKCVSASAAATATAAAVRNSLISRGSNQPRGSPAFARSSRPTPHSPIGGDGSSGAKITVSLTAIYPTVPSSHLILPPPVPRPPSLSQGALIRQQETVISDKGVQSAKRQMNHGDTYDLRTASTNANVQGASSPQSPPTPSRPVFTLEEFMEIVKSNIDAVIAPLAFKNTEKVKELLQGLKFPSGAINAKVKIDDSLICIGKEIYLSLNSTFSKIMKFHNRPDFINHH